jgi:hypothetical protein
MDRALLALLLASLSLASTFAGDAVIKIPSDQIWSNASPRSHSLRSLEPDLLLYRDTPEKIAKYSTPEGIAELKEKASKSLVVKIERAMSKKQALNGKPQAGFAVKGKGRDALNGVYSVLAEGKNAQSQFSPDDDVSIVFFSLPASVSVSVDRIERINNVVKVFYFVAHQPRATIDWHLSLISLGKLEPGKYQVEMIRSPIEQHPSPRVQEYIRDDKTRVDPQIDSSIICEPFSFEVVSRTKQEASNVSSKDCCAIVGGAGGFNTGEGKH